MTEQQTAEAKATAAASGSSATIRFLADKQSSGTTSKERVNTLATEVITAVHDVIRRHKVSYDEYNALKAWMIQVGQDG
ncbi:MAG: catechol 1,2-dioxygenase, partial [Streptomyces sp.]|nr:catechol 1,2-dioxygenase [Streptomyces sp.]